MRNNVFHIKYVGDLVSASVRTTKSGHVYRTEEYKSFMEMLSWLTKANYSGDVIDNRLFEVKLKICKKNTVGRKHKGGRGDIDNLIKPILDSLTGIVWKDDTQVVELHCKLKRDTNESSLDLDVFDIGAWHRYRTKVICGNCGKEFEVINYRTRQQKVLCCSRKCLYELHQKDIVCLQCGKHFTHKRSAKRGIKFCSSDCYWKHMREHSDEYPNIKEALNKANLAVKFKARN